MKQPVHILHLEDDAKDAELARAILESEGMPCQITRVQTRKEFGDALREGGLDIILADFRLPSFNGMAALEIAQDQCPEIPFVFVSGMIGEDAAIEALTRGATDYVLKQKLSRLAHAVKRALREAENRRERKRAQDAIRKSQEQFRVVVQTAHDAIITMGAQQQIVFWNLAAERIFGYSSNEMLGQPITQLVPKEQRHEEQLASRRAYERGTRTVTGKTIETIALNKEGKELPIELSLTDWQTDDGLLFTAIIRDISERKQRERELQSIVTLSAAMRTASTRSEMLPVVVEQMVRLLSCDSAAIEIIDPLTGEVVVEAAQGDWESLTGLRQKPRAGLNAIVSQIPQPYRSSDLEQDPNLGYPAWARAGIRSNAGVPLIAQGKLIGFLWVGRKTELTDTELHLLSAITDITANAIHRATLHEQAQLDAAELALAYETTLEGWANALELRDQETEGHSRRVVKMTLDLARAMSLDEREMENIRRGALLHDIGKMGIPDSVLLKPGTLNEREWEIMKRHPEYAYRLLSPIEYLHKAIDIPYCHHEKWDGTGYPRGLRGEEIPLAARIFAVVDVWDALTSDRPYRNAWSKEKTQAYLSEQAGKSFDPKVVEVFLELLAAKHAIPLTPEAYSMRSRALIPRQMAHSAF